LNISKETSDFITLHQHVDVRNLALKASAYPEVDFPLAIRQIAGRQIAAVKLPSWHAIEQMLYPAHISLEQCSSEWTARYKASLIKGNTLVDLTGGLGVDCAFLAENFDSVTYVEFQEELAELASHNFELLSLKNISIKCMKAESYLSTIQKVSCIYIDPARRDKYGKKTILPSDCEPDVVNLKDKLLQKADSVWIKFSPMLDISLSLSQLTETTEIHIISLENECKELLFKIVPDKNPSEPSIYCINIKKNGNSEYFSFKRSEEINRICNFTDSLQTYLYEPNSSILKAGAFKSITASYPLNKLHKNSHLYTSDQLIEHFPGRIFRINFTSSLNKKNIRKILSDTTQANISIRNFPLPVNELRKRLNLKEGGNLYIFGTTLHNNEKVIIGCEKIQ
jgi:hypothetical protein